MSPEKLQTVIVNLLRCGPQTKGGITNRAILERGYRMGQVDTALIALQRAGRVTFYRQGGIVYFILQGA
jgi:hypothetical protein